MGRTISVVLALVLSSAAQQPSSQTARADAVFQEANSLTLQILDQQQRDYVISELARAELRGGFRANAVSTAMRSGDNSSVLLQLGRIEAQRGQYDSAMAIVAKQGQAVKDEVRLEIGIEQARRGEIQLALDTTGSMRDSYEKETVLYFTAVELLRQGETARARQIASSFTAPDHVLPERTVDYEWRQSSPPPPPLEENTPAKEFYQPALAQLRAGDVHDAILLIEADKNPADVSSNFSRLSRAAAELGNLDVALDLAARVHVSGAEYEEGYYSSTMLPIGRLWGQKDANAAVQWARGRSTPAEKVLALSGVAEGVAARARD